MGFGGGGSGSVSGSSDVALNSPVNQDVLTYDSSVSKWKNAASATAPVTSVAGKTGVVTLVKGDVGLGNVDNTADTAKPISTAAQTALNGKANTTHTHDSGDITTGTINTARLPVATSSTVGVVQLATQAIATAGTDTTTAVTPQGLKSAITAAIPTVVFVDDLSQIPPGTPVDTLVVVRTA